MTGDARRSLLVGRVDRRVARTGRLAADVEQVGALGDHPPRLRDGARHERRPVGADVAEQAVAAERVGRDVDDAHDERASPEAQLRVRTRAVPGRRQAQPHAAHRSGARRPAAARRPEHARTWPTRYSEPPTTSGPPASRARSSGAPSASSASATASADRAWSDRRPALAERRTPRGPRRVGHVGRDHARVPEGGSEPQRREHAVQLLVAEDTDQQRGATRDSCGRSSSSARDERRGTVRVVGAVEEAVGPRRRLSSFEPARPSRGGEARAGWRRDPTLAMPASASASTSRGPPPRSPPGGGRADRGAAVRAPGRSTVEPVASPCPSTGSGSHGQRAARPCAPRAAR